MRRAFDRWAAPSLLGVGGLLAAVATLFSAGSSNGRLVWIGLAALLVVAALGAGAFLGLPRPALGREAAVALSLLAAFVAWNGVSVLWSIEPDRSWDYFNRGLVYLALAVVGIAVGSFVPRAARAWAYVLAVALALPLGWALLTKAVPSIGSDTGRVARLSAPLGYWNALALLFAMALPLALWLAARREHAHWLRALGVLYAYALVVGLLLTYSRGGVLAGGVAVVLWLVLGRPRVESAAALLLGGGAALGVAVWAFSRPGLAEDGQTSAVRAHDGAWFAVVFLLAALAVAAFAYLGSIVEERRPLSDRRRRLVGQAALAVLVVGLVAGVIALAVESKPEGWFKEFTAQPTNAGAQEGPGRIINASSSSRWLWWKEAWQAFEKQPLHGTGAGTFELTHRLLRTNSIVVTEPHNVPLQFLSETGIVGLLPVPRLPGRGRAGGGARRSAVGGDRAGGGGGVIRARVRIPAALAGGLRLGLRRGERAVLHDRRRAARGRRGAGRAAALAGALAGGGGLGDRALAAHPVVCQAGHRCRDLGARRRAAAPGVPRRAGCAVLEPARARPAVLAGGRRSCSWATSRERGSSTSKG